jgi:hypothetical protein
MKGSSGVPPIDGRSSINRDGRAQRVARPICVLVAIRREDSCHSRDDRAGRIARGYLNANSQR